MAKRNLNKRSWGHCSHNYDLENHEVNSLNFLLLISGLKKRSVHSSFHLFSLRQKLLEHLGQKRKWHVVS